ncbi:hypothetical protein WJX72_003049 [[Myrmecia] bisecta]|uniref:Uncharacterized protein n=1 Tax=[Myrmecia] bisecta TaxID=41462 RepID=A0AAW1Q004_9CHLO
MECLRSQSATIYPACSTSSRAHRHRCPNAPRQSLRPSELIVTLHRQRRAGHTRRQRRLASHIRASSVVLPGDSSLPADEPSAGQKLLAFQQAFWKFLRPHTIRGTILGSCAVTARALIENPQCIDWALLPRALLGVLALLCGNGYIVGINQIFDQDLDTVNKPYLPIAAGELSPSLAWLLCAGLAAGGLSLTAINFGPLITSLYSLGLFLGTIYSVPPFHLKRFAVPAFLIIATVRGFLLNFGVYYAVRAALRLPFQWCPAVVFITVFVTVFATVIAITKDLADVEGDRAHNIRTFATQLGVPGVSKLGAGILWLNYAGAVVVGLAKPQLFNQWPMVGVHAVLGLLLLLQLDKLNKAGFGKAAVAAFYRFIWNLFYLEYALLPFL